MRSLLFVGQSVRVKSKALVMEEFVCLRKERLREREREREKALSSKYCSSVKRKGLRKGLESTTRLHFGFRSKRSFKKYQVVALIDSRLQEWRSEVNLREAEVQVWREVLKLVLKLGHQESKLVR